MYINNTPFTKLGKVFDHSGRAKMCCYDSLKVDSFFVIFYCNRIIIKTWKHININI